MIVTRLLILFEFAIIFGILILALIMKYFKKGQTKKQKFMFNFSIAMVILLGIQVLIGILQFIPTATPFIGVVAGFAKHKPLNFMFPK